MEPTPTGIPDPTSIATWPAAFVAITLILSLLVVPSILTYLGNQRVRRVENTLQATNGGSTVRDSLNRIEQQQRELASDVRTVQGDLTQVGEDTAATAVGLGQLRADFETHLTAGDAPAGGDEK